MRSSSDQQHLLECFEVEEQHGVHTEKTTAPASRASHTGRTVMKMMSFVLPSWLQRTVKEQSSTSERFPRPTAYLDGMRGLVSVLVYLRHFSLPWQEHLDYGYGYKHAYYDVLRLPFLRLFFSGPLVPVFFVVSGYVLSSKSLKLSRKQAWQDLFLALASSAFRRTLRLFLPPLISTMTVMFMAYGGLFSFDYSLMPGRQPEHPVALENLSKQIIQWTKFAFGELTNPWTWDRRRMLYGPHLWTIPVSFQGSLVVFLMCLALVRCKPFIRMIILVVVMLVTKIHGRYHMAPFIGGILLCELDLTFNRGEGEGEGFATSVRTRVSLWLMRTFNITILLTGLYIGSFPRYNDHGEHCVPGYQWFCRITPDYHYWHGIAAPIMFIALSRERLIQYPLESRLVQYFGSISFSLYICHEPFIHIVAFRTVPLFWQLTGNQTMLGYQLGFVLGFLTSGFVLVWIADRFKVGVEDRCAKFSAKVEAYCFVRTS